ncbi:hypothetical protein L6452_36734 [Arctium lappa]|uniref:Uncharacterized protein n=1 Tax=Arctium lappa TaxID=4217 RepID=A0ACB8Y1T2_ARCLA|nr:hypothetical protein L6452_36734 [Arctium lappa]
MENLAESNSTLVSKVPMLKPNEFDMWKIRIRQYILLTDYSMWDIIKNGPSEAGKIGPDGKRPPPKTDGERKIRQTEMKALSTLLLAIPNEYQHQFCNCTDAQILWNALEKRFAGTKRIKRNQRDVLKQQYENFTSSKNESMTQTFDRFNKLIGELATVGVKMEQDDINRKFLRSLGDEWTMYTVSYRQSDNLEEKELDDLYNDLRVFETEVETKKKPTGYIHNAALLSASTDTTANPEAVSTASGVNSEKGTETIFEAFLSSHSNNSLINDDLDQFHPDDLEEMDIKWQMAMLSMRVKKFIKRTGRNNFSQRRVDGAGFDKTKVECYNVSTAENINAANSVTTANSVSTAENINAANTVTTANKVSTAKHASTAHAGNQQLKGKSIWHVDSGCSRHMTGNMSCLQDFKHINGGHVAFGDNLTGGKISGKGNVTKGKMTFEDVYYVDQLKYNVLSVSQVCDKQHSILFTNTEYMILAPGFKVVDESMILLRTPRKDNVYCLDMDNVDSDSSLNCLVSKASVDESSLWHRRMCHMNFKTMNKLVKNNLVRGLPSKVFSCDDHCVACLKGKQHKTSHKTKELNTISSCLQLLHMDLFGPTNVMSIGKKSFCLVIVDDYSRFTWVYFLRTKDETSGLIKSFILRIENQTNQKVKVIRSDNGTEFKNFDLNTFCEEKGIERQYNAPRTPQQNGVAERRNRTLIEAARSLSDDYAGSGSGGSGTTQVQESISQSVIFPIPTVDPVEDCEKEPSTEPSQSEEESRDEETQENKEPEVATENTSVELNDSNLEVELNEEPSHHSKIQKNHPPQLVIGDISSPMMTRNQSRLQEIQAQQHTVLSCFLSQLEPKKAHDAMKESSWIEAMQEELLQFKLQDVWDLVDLPKGQRAIGTK